MRRLYSKIISKSSNFRDHYVTIVTEDNHEVTACNSSSRSAVYSAYQKTKKYYGDNYYYPTWKRYDSRKHKGDKNNELLIKHYKNLRSHYGTKCLHSIFPALSSFLLRLSKKGFLFSPLSKLSKL